MSRSKRRRRGVRAATPPAPRRASRAWIGLVVIAVLLAVSLGWWNAQRRHLVSVAVVPVPLDSLRAAEQMFEAATRRNDLTEALRLQERIAAALPRNPLALRQLAETLHNHHFAVTLPDGRPHWLLRNSLVRAEWEARVMALFDSSAAVAQDPVDRALAHYWKGRSADYEGLSLDALAEYEAGLEIVPTDTVMRRARDLELQRLRSEP